MAVVSATAPGRAGIIGNPSDIYGGTVVSCTVPRRARVTVEPAAQRRWGVCGEAGVLEGPDWTCADPDRPLLDLPKAVWRYLTRDNFPWRDRIIPDATFSLVAVTDVPMYSGFAGSTALVAAVMGAMLGWFGIELGPHELAEQVRAAEFDEMAVTCGFQDSYMTVFGGLNCVDCRDKALPRPDGERPYAALEPLAHLVPDLPFVLANTGEDHNSGEVHSGPRRRYEAGEEEVVAGFHRVGELGRLGKKALLRGDWVGLGRLMNENHEITRRLKGSGEANEALIAAALRAGALGAKLSGAGRGGTIIALHEDPDYVEQALCDAGAAFTVRLQPQEGLTVTKERC